MKRHPVPAWIRSQNRHDNAHTLAGRHAVNSGHIGGHYGAMYWAIAAYFTSEGIPNHSPAIATFAAKAWEREATGGYRPFRPMHARLYRAALKVAKAKYQDATKKARKRSKAA